MPQKRKIPKGMHRCSICTRYTKYKNRKCSVCRAKKRTKVPRSYKKRIQKTYKIAGY